MANKSQIDRSFALEYLSGAQSDTERQAVLQELSEHFGTSVDVILQAIEEQDEPSGDTLASPDNMLGTLLEESWKSSRQTGKEFCAELGISETSFYNYRKGTQVPMRKRMEALCKKLNVDNDDRDSMIASHQPKSIGIVEEELLFDLLIEGWPLEQIEETFKENGFDRNRSWLRYYRNRLMDDFDLRPMNKQGEVEDPTAKTIKKILENEKSSKTKPCKKVVSEQNERMQRGDVFQEYAHFIHMLATDIRKVVPEYALTVIKDPQTGEVVHTTDIIDIVADTTAMEIKIGKYDPVEIRKQVLRQLRAIRRLQARGDADANSHINSVKHIDVVVLEECEETDILREEFSDHPDVHVQEIGFLVDYHARRLTKSGPAFAAMYEMIKLGRIKGDELRCVRDFLHALNTGIDFHKLYNIAHRDATKLRRRMAKGFEVLHNAKRITDDLVEKTLRDVVQIPRDVRKEETSYMMCHYEEDGQLLATRRRFKKPDQRHLGTLRRLWTEAGQDTPFECTMENLQTIVEYQEQRESERQSQPATLQKEREFSYEDMYYAATEIRAERKTGHDTEIAREVGEFGSQHIEGRYRMMYATNSKERIREAVEIVKQVFTPMSRVSNAGRMHLATNWKGHFQDEKRMGFWKTLTYLITNYRALKKVTGGVRAMQRLARGDESTYDMELHELLDTLSTQNDEAYEHFQRHGNELCRVSPAEMKYLLQKETRFRKNGIKCLSEADQKGVTSMYMHDTSMDNRYFASATSTTARRAAAIALVNPDLARTYLKMTIGAHKHGSIPTYHRLATMREDDPVYESIAGSYGNLGDKQIYQAVTEMDGDVNTIAENLAVIHLECPSLAKDFFRYAKYNQRGKMDIIMSLEGPDYYHLPEIRGKLSRARDDELAQIEFGKPILGQLK